MLEHITDPFLFLDCVHGKLADDGRVFIEVPNLYDPLLKLWKVPAYERFYFHEAHLSYFTEKSLKKMLKKCGFEVENFYYLQDYNLLNNLYWWFNNSPQDSCEFGLSKPKIDFRDEEIGNEINTVLEYADEKYKSILEKHGMTSNIFVVARKY